MYPTEQLCIESNVAPQDLMKYADITTFSSGHFKIRKKGTSEINFNIAFYLLSISETL